MKHAIDIEGIAPEGVGDVVFTVCAEDIEREAAGSGEDAGVYPDAGGVFQHDDIADIVVESAKLNGVDPQAWLTDALGRIAEHKITKLDELMPLRYSEASA